MVEKINHTELTVLIMFVEFRGSIWLRNGTLYLMNIMITMKKINGKLGEQQAADQKCRRDYMQDGFSHRFKVKRDPVPIQTAYHSQK